MISCPVKGKKAAVKLSFENHVDDHECIELKKICLPKYMNQM